jgi:hypothetical protein
MFLVIFIVYLLNCTWFLSFILVLLVKTFQVCFVKTFVLFAHYKVDNFLYKNLILKRYATGLPTSIFFAQFSNY